MSNYKIESKSLFKIFPGLIISSFCLIILFNQMNWRDFYQNLNSANLKWILLGILFLFLDYLLRIERWSYLLRQNNNNLKWAKCSIPYLNSITLNNCLPLRAGDILRIFIFPKKMNIESSISFNSILMERILDIFVIGLMANIGFYLQGNLDSKISVISLAFFSISILLIPSILILRKKLIVFFKWTYQKDFLKSISKFFIKVLFQIKDFLKVKLLFNVFIQTIGIWIFEALLIFFIFKSLNYQISLVSLLIIFSSITFSTLVPSTPGYIGTFHLAGYLSAKALGIPEDISISFSILSHAILWTLTTVPGLVFIFLRSINSFNSEKNLGI